MLLLSKIMPDENQPRKLFEPEKLKSLKDSIKKFGVLTPITVEKIGDKYLLIDGERRYRASKDLNLDKIPAVIAEPSTEVDRLVKQFHVQEQYAGWTPTEKASTVSQLSNKLGLSVYQICELLALPNTTGRRYMAFADLLDQKNFTKNEIGIEFAPRFIGLRSLAKKLYTQELKEEFTRKMERDLETAVIHRIKEGEFSKPSQLTKLVDIFTKNPKLIAKFTDGKTTVDSLFLESKAQATYYLRNGVNNAYYTMSNFRKFLESPDVKLSDSQILKLKETIKMIQAVITKATLD